MVFGAIGRVCCGAIFLGIQLVTINLVNRRGQVIQHCQPHCLMYKKQHNLYRNQNDDDDPFRKR